MPLKFVDRFKVGFQVIVEAKEGFLLGGRTIDDGVVCDTFFEALDYMNAVIQDNAQADRNVELRRCWSFEGCSRRPSSCQIV